jgi:hypothetical protein
MVRGYMGMKKDLEDKKLDEEDLVEIKEDTNLEEEEQNDFDSGNINISDETLDKDIFNLDEIDETYVPEDDTQTTEEDKELDILKTELANLKSELGNMSSRFGKGENKFDFASEVINATRGQKVSNLRTEDILDLIKKRKFTNMLRRFEWHVLADIMDDIIRDRESYSLSEGGFLINSIVTEKAIQHSIQEEMNKVNQKRRSFLKRRNPNETI